MRTRDLGGLVGGAVDHDEHVHRHAAASFRHVLQDRSDTVGLVVRGDDHYQFGEARPRMVSVEFCDGKGIHLVRVVGEPPHAVTDPTSSRK